MVFSPWCSRDDHLAGHTWVKGWKRGKGVKYYSTKRLPVPGKAVVAVVAKHRLAVLDRVGSCPRNCQLKFSDKNCPWDCSVTKWTLARTRAGSCCRSLDFHFPWENSTHPSSSTTENKRKTSRWFYDNPHELIQFSSIPIKNSRIKTKSVTGQYAAISFPRHYYFNLACTVFINPTSHQCEDQS